MLLFNMICIINIHDNLAKITIKTRRIIQFFPTSLYSMRTIFAIGIVSENLTYNLSLIRHCGYFFITKKHTLKIICNW